jgi:periplasmic copper chaperone A
MRTGWILGVAAFMLASAGAQAHEYKLGDVTIEHPWARPTAGDTGLGATYFVLKNAGERPEVLKSASSPDAGTAQIHENIHEPNGVMKMRAVEGVTIPPGGTVAFEPGGYHVMLIGLKHHLEEGHSIPLKLTFEHAGSVDVEVKIEKKPEEAGGMHEHHH